MKNYLLGDAFKILLAAGCLPLAWRVMDRLHRDDESRVSSVVIV